MIDPKPIDKLNALDGARDDLTPWNVARAAALANLIVATMVFAEFSVMSLVEHDSKAFQLELWLVPFVTLVIWVAAALLYLLELAPMGLWALGRRLVGRSRSSLPARSGVWDDWLDSPDQQDR